MWSANEGTSCEFDVLKNKWTVRGARFLFLRRLLHGLGCCWDLVMRLLGPFDSVVDGNRLENSLIQHSPKADLKGAKLSIAESVDAVYTLFCEV